MGGVGEVRGSIIAAGILGIVETGVLHWSIRLNFSISILNLYFNSSFPPTRAFGRAQHDGQIGKIDLRCYFHACCLLATGCDGYWLGIGVDVMMYIALATSGSVLWTGLIYISLASAAFFGIGGFIVGTGMVFMTLLFGRCFC